MKEPVRQRSVMKEKRSIIVLIVAAVIFIAAFYRLYSEDILNGAGDVFVSKGEEIGRAHV